MACYEQLRHGESHFNSFVCSCPFYRVCKAHELDFKIIATLSFFFHRSVPFLTSETELSPQRNKMLNSAEKMPSPRVLKSHLPFYLLHPKLLDTSKVSLNFDYFT